MKDSVKEYKEEVDYFCNKYGGIICSLDASYSQDDFKNDLWMLVFESVNKYGKKTKRLLIRTVLYNHYIRLLRHGIIKNKFLINFTDTENKNHPPHDGKNSPSDFSENIKEGLYSCTIPGPHDDFDGKDLMSLISNWVSERDDCADEIIKGILVPSSYLQERCEKETSKSKMHMNCKLLPPQIIAKVLGIKYRDCRKVMDDLKKFLRNRGYRA
jgi:hypothetical protein